MRILSSQQAAGTIVPRVGTVSTVLPGSRLVRLLFGLIAFGLLLIAVPAAAQQHVVTEFGNDVLYFANSQDPGFGSSWQSVAFDDAGWPSGWTGLGYENGNGADALLHTVVPSGTQSIYVRIHFNVDDPAQVANMFLGADYDDGYVAWLNGTEIYRSPEMPAGPVAWDTSAAVGEASNAATPNYNLQDLTTTGVPLLVAGNNVLAIGVFNAASASSDLVLVPQLILNRDTDIVRGPYLQSTTSDGMTLRWRTATPQGSRVDFGAGPANLSNSVVQAEETTEHSVTLTGLSPDTRYYYAVGNPAALLVGADNDHYFETAPVAGTLAPTRVWVVGDSGTGTPAAAEVRNAYAAIADRHTDVWLMLGDNAYPDGTDAEYQVNLFDIYAQALRRWPLWPTIGNHDAVSSNSTFQDGPYFDIFDLPVAGEAGGLPSGTEAYYSFDYANIHFVVLDSQGSDRSPLGDMLTWLEQDLAATSQDWVIAYWHHPPYSKGSHDSDSELALIQMRENAVPILEAHGVDLVLTGHSHSYERSFLLDSHYGDSTTLTESMKVNPGDGRPDGDGVYTKTDPGLAPHQGTVYTVAGNGGSVVSNSNLNHPAMFVGMAVMGSVILDVDGTRLDAQFLSKDGEILDSFSILKGCADQDKDGVCADEDNCLEVANPGQENADGDALGDACDACPNDAANEDPDQDDVCSADDNCPDAANPLQEDDDADGLGNACDPCPSDAGNDEDGDGVCNSDDNCVLEPNSAQSDIDGDGIGDACDGCPADADNDRDVDGVCGDQDNCPTFFNSSQSDFDGDGAGDDCDICPLDLSDDSDGDTICSNQDNCPNTANPGQANADGDFSGDACDPCPFDRDNDFDGDGLCADADNCPNLNSPDQTDSDSDGIGDLCDIAGDADGDGHLDQEDNCTFVSNPVQRDADQDGQGDACDNDDDDDGTSDGGDCAAYASGVSDTPGAIGSTLVLLDPVTTTLQWSRALQGHTSNVYRGFAMVGQPLDQLSCFDTETPVTESIDIEVPPAGGLFYYVVTGFNVCGEGRPGGGPVHPRLPLPTCAPQGADSDGDSVPDLMDNCALTQNYAQDDFDNDYVGDFCDNCPTVYNPEQDDADGDEQGDACEGALDSDGDGTPDAADNCPEIFNVDQVNIDADAFGDACDSCPADFFNDIDNDGLCANFDNCPDIANPSQDNPDLDQLGSACDPCPLDANNDIDRDNVCGDIDNCPFATNPTQEDNDSDGLGDPCDADDDNDEVDDATDNCPQDANTDQTDTDEDGLGDACDACPASATGDTDDDGACDDIDNCVDQPNPAQDDHDGDGAGDVCDPDDDNDGVLDADDSDPLNNTVCRDADGDTCDDCVSGSDDAANDGDDFDTDGLCDAGDPDDDNDGVADESDSEPLNNLACRDADGDTCDDCSSGTDNPTADGDDLDADGLCDAGDTDDDGDSVGDLEDSDPRDATVCRDADGDTCDDCSSGSDNPADDGADQDADGLCDAGDLDDDNDGVDDVNDSDPLNANICRDLDNDTCDDCASGADDPANDGADFDADGICDAGDTDDDSDGVDDVEDSDPLNSNVCRDTDGDTCDDCASGVDNPSNDGDDFDGDGSCDAGDSDDDNDGVEDAQDSAPFDATLCRDADGDACDDCASGVDDPLNDGVDFDNDGLCDTGDADDDNDGVDDGEDSDPFNANVCRDADGDTCEDCVGGFDDPANDGDDFDGDGLCDAGDADDDNDGVGDALDSDPLNNTVCRDADGDTCEDCSGGSDDPANDGDDFDADGLCNAGDADDDNDGVGDALDSDPLNNTVCRDVDNDTCDDCSGGSDDPAGDGDDFDADGICDAGDADDDNDGVDDVEDSDPLNSSVCRDTDNDTCDDCASGADAPANDGSDFDTDGICDAGDPDDDNDGVDDGADSDPFDANVCRDADGDTCEDCSSGVDNPADDGEDYDDDGLCDLGDPDDDNDGILDGPDSDPLDSFVCTDIDFDTCDDCSSGSFSPANDGDDFDMDGLCNIGDADDDNDGILDGPDSDPLNSFVCTDIDFDSCDDCTSGTFQPANDGLDTDSDGRCDLGDTDDDGDGVPDVDDNEPLNPFACRDNDGDTCDDCSSGVANPNNDGTDSDADGLCDLGDPCTNDPLNDADADGHCADVDNCPTMANPGQEDADNDGIGDACDCELVLEDDFAVDGSPPPNWTEVRGTWTAVNQTLQATSGPNDALAVASNRLCSTEQWARASLQGLDRQGGVVLRQVGASALTPRYAVVVEADKGRFRWLTCTTGCTEIESSETDAISFDNGDSLTALVVGTEATTELRVWKNAIGNDPLLWGTPDWTTSVIPSGGELADSGLLVGVYTERSGGSSTTFNDFAAGSTPALTP